MRWILGTAGAVAIVAAVAAGVWLVQRGSPSHTSVIGGASPPARIGGPLLRDPNALMLGTHAGDVLLGLAAVPGRVEVVVVPGDTSHIPIGDVRIAVRGHASTLSRCGRACFAVEAPVLNGTPAALSVDLRRQGHRPDLAVVRLPAHLPPQAHAMLTAASRRMRAVRTVQVRETLSSGDATLRSLFSFAAPDRMSYVTSVGSKAIVIGKRRWDWDNGRWHESSDDPIQAPAYNWEGAGRPRLLGRAVVAGVSVRVLAAFRPNESYPAWFRLFVARDGRILRMEMSAPAHFMVDRYTGLDRPLRIEPPR
jgi:hypothetical protein